MADDWELISKAEPPVTIREFELAIAKTGLMTRSERQLAWRALSKAGLLVFRA